MSQKSPAEAKAKEHAATGTGRSWQQMSERPLMMGRAYLADFDERLAASYTPAMFPRGAIRMVAGESSTMRRVSSLSPLIALISAVVQWPLAKRNE
jgi:hypothetical protein